MSTRIACEKGLNKLDKLVKCGLSTDHVGVLSDLNQAVRTSHLTDAWDPTWSVHPANTVFSEFSSEDGVMGLTVSKKKKFVPSLAGVVFLHIDHVQN